ncbi:MAG: vWA domain-containing protein [Myxococcota bacterium]
MLLIRAAISLALLLLPWSAAAERIWAELDSPLQREVVREPVGLVEVRGWAGTGQRGQHDVVLVIDRTASTFEPSGADVDGDGVVGRTVRIGNVGNMRRTLEVVSDPDDTIASAELVAARRLIERLDPTSTRMGLVTFARTEKVLARIGTPAEDLLSSLDSLPSRPGPGGTYFYGAIIAAIKVFEQAPPDGGNRHRSIIFLSDGLPNRPSPPAAAAKAAVRASQHAANARIRIYSFALGPEVASHPEVFLRMAEANGGELLIVEDPGGIIDFVPHMSLTALEGVEIDNLSMSRSARAVRLFPDGTFDGYVPLVPGENLLRITIRGEAGGTHTIDRRVVFEKTPSNTPEGKRRLASLLKELQIRTLETQLAEQAKRKREYVIKRQLEITVEQ